ncbi:MAG: uroporphyrinogen-III synthase [Gammaproteobacteria bacterium]|nr:uroporphyrinogen-III synthase [Gammaproteobacteria bacterium]
MSTAAAEPGSDLAGCRVLVTRPEHQAQRLCALIARAGGRAQTLPVIEIAAPGDPDALADLLARLDRFDIAIFVSGNAVDRVCAELGGRPWPPAVRLAAVGRGSAAALAQHGLHADILPPREFNSEGLLELEALRNVAGRRIVIFRAQDGRELLAETLRARGAEVEHVEAYCRVLPAASGAGLRRIAGEDNIDTIVVTSNEGLSNLYLLAGADGRDWLLRRQLIVISARAAQLAAELGFLHPARVAIEASDEGLLAAIRSWWCVAREGSEDGTHAAH